MCLCDHNFYFELFILRLNLPLAGVFLQVIYSNFVPSCAHSCVGFTESGFPKCQELWCLLEITREGCGVKVILNVRGVIRTYQDCSSRARIDRCTLMYLWRVQATAFLCKISKLHCLIFSSTWITKVFVRTIALNLSLWPGDQASFWGRIEQGHRDPNLVEANFSLDQGTAVCTLVEEVLLW